jgi:hypothetical protein
MDKLLKLELKIITKHILLTFYYTLLIVIGLVAFTLPAIHLFTLDTHGEIIGKFLQDIPDNRFWIITITISIVVLYEVIWSFQNFITYTADIINSCVENENHFKTFLTFLLLIAAFISLSYPLFLLGLDSIEDVKRFIVISKGFLNVLGITVIAFIIEAYQCMMFHSHHITLHHHNNHKGHNYNGQETKN